jgi:Na+/melibiose symporter-like transporter
MMMIFQLKFYTDVFGLDGAVAGSVLMVASISAIIVDPAIGLLTDHTKTRWGKFRPWMLWTAIPFCVFYILAFYNPGIHQKSSVAIYATISYVLLMTAYSFNNIPYCSLGGVMTSDIRERTSITTIRFVVVTIAQFVVQGLTLPLVDHFAEGHTLQHGWSCTIAIFACIAFVFFIITFAVSKERIQPPPRQLISVKEDIKNTYNYIRANEKTILSPKHSLVHLDVTVQVTVLLGVGVHKGIGGAVFASIVSSIFGRNLKSALGIIGNISIGGAIERAINLNDRVSMLSENGAKNVLVPMENLQEMAALPATILGKTDIPLYANTQMLIQKMI